MVDFIKGFDLHTIIIVGVAFFWLNSSLSGRMSDIEKRLDTIEKDMAVIKTVLTIHKLIPDCVVKNNSKIE